MGQLIERDNLSRTVERLRSEGRRIVTTNGCFDLLHVGHVRILKAARALGDVLIIGLNSDASVRKLKGPSRPLTPEQERAEILCCLSVVDYVSIFDEDTPVEFLKVVKPDIHVKGSDYCPADLAETPVVEEFGGQVKILELVPDRSTSSIVAKMKGQ